MLIQRTSCSNSPCPLALQAGGASALQLDLRDNRGGLVSEGLEVARLFLQVPRAASQVPLLLRY